MKLSMSKKIRELLKDENMTIKELSTKIGRTNQNMANKLKRDNFSVNELIEISDALECTLDINFIQKIRKNGLEIYLKIPSPSV